VPAKIANIARHRASAAAVLAIGLLLSAAGSHWAANQFERDANTKFESAVDDAEDGIKQRVQAYADVLHAVRGLFTTSESVSRDAFRRYVASLNLEQRYPGIQLVAFNRRVPFEQKRDYEAAVRRDTSVDPKGYPDFAIKPPGDRPEYFVAEYLEPMAGNEDALGLDAGGDRVRAASVEHARDSGQLAASGRITLVRGDARHAGFTLRLPIYRNGMPQQTVEQRRQAFVGSIVSSYRMNNVMRGAVSEQLLRQLHISIHDAGFSRSATPPDASTAENLLYDNGPLRNGPSAQPVPSHANDENASFSKTLTLDVGGRRWNLYFTARQGFAAPFDRWQPLAILLGGISVTLLLFGLIRSLATSGSRAVTLAESITEDLRQSEARLAKAQRQTQELIEALPNPIYFKSTDGRYLGVNRAWEKFFGVSRNTFIGKTVADLYPNDPEIARRLQADDQALWDHPGTKTYETSITTPDAQHHDVIYYKATFTHTDGSVAGLIGTIVDISERKQTEAAMKASEGHYRAMFENAAVGITRVDLNGMLVDVNQKFCDMLGHARAELLGKSVKDITHPDDYGPGTVARGEITRGATKSAIGEKRFLHKDGSVVWARRSMSIVRDAAGNAQFIISVVEDITERKQAEEALLVANSQLQMLVQSSPLAIYTRDMNGMLTSWNPAAEKMYGWKASEVLGKPLPSVSDEARPESDALRMRLLAGEAFIKHVARRRRRDGSPIDIDASLAPLRDVNGNVNGIIAVVADITERKQAEAAARASEERFRATFDQAAVGIVHTSYEGRYLLVNQKFCDMLGYRDYELVGRAATDFTHPDDRETGRQKRQLIWDGKLAGYTEEKRYLRKNGTVIWTNRTVSLARDASGKPLYFIRVIEDITERKEAEERYRATFENAPVGIMHTAIDGYRILRANRKLCEMLGYTRDELLGMTSTDIVHPDYRFSDRISYRQPILDGERPSFASERKFIRKDGSSFWVSRTVSLVRNAAGEPLYFIRIVEDIDERKQAEAALRDSEMRYRSVIAAIAEGVVLRDQDARIVTCNASAERILGKTLDQMRGSMFYDPAWQAIREDGTPFPLDERPIRVALRTGQLQSNVVQGLRKQDGTVLWLSMNVQPLFNESDSTLTGVVSTLTDITARKQAELRQTMEHAITRILAEADAPEDAMPRIIRTICETMEWHCGARWVWDKEAMLLRCREMWGIDTPEIREFITASANGTISPEPAGQGLVRRTYASGQPIWISDVTQVKGLLKRASLVTKAGLHGAFGFPLLLGGEVLGVMEFFHRDVREPDASLIKIAESIGNQIGQFMARKQAEERIRHLANYDELTGLPNRSMFQERLHHALAQAHRHARPLAVLFIDLDRFKDINDTLGHEAGDHVLRDVAERLRTCLRDSDTVGRLGGDEFVVLLEELPQLADVAAVAQKILDAAARPFMLAAKEFHIGASIGISAFPEDGKDLQTLLKNADAAMYRAKVLGRNNYQFHSPPALPH